MMDNVAVEALGRGNVGRVKSAGQDINYNNFINYIFYLPFEPELQAGSLWPHFILTIYLFIHYLFTA